MQEIIVCMFLYLEAFVCVPTIVLAWVMRQKEISYFFGGFVDDSV